MTKIKYLAAVAAGILPAIQAAAQQAQPEMADAMRSNGKIYVVVAVCLTILAGLIFYVAALDRKIRKMEKNNRGM